MNDLVETIFPNSCLACKHKIYPSSQEQICHACLLKIEKNLPPFCHSCGRRLVNPIPAKNLCPHCLKRNLHFDRAFSPCVYDGVIKELIHEFKYRGKDYLGKPLSRLMIDFIKEYSLPMDYIDFVIPVPLYKTKLREREFNQAEILAELIAKEFKKDMPKDLLVRHRHTKTQADLDIPKRILNVQNSFSVARSQGLEGKNLLLVDDVLTTGATSSEAARALKKEGASIVFVLTLAN